MWVRCGGWMGGMGFGGVYRGLGTRGLEEHKLTRHFRIICASIDSKSTTKGFDTLLYGNPESTITSHLIFRTNTFTSNQPTNPSTPHRTSIKYPQLHKTQTCSQPENQIPKTSKPHPPYHHNGLPLLQTPPRLRLRAAYAADQTRAAAQT